MKKEFSNYDDLAVFAQALVDEKKWAIATMELENGAGYAIQWIEHKYFKTHDDKEFPDEIWTTKEGQMMCVQDLEPEHARNVLRMLLRQDREKSAMMQQIMETIQAEGGLEELFAGHEDQEAAVPHTLH